MTRKQKKEIARMWIASISQNVGTDSFEDEDCSAQDASDIVEECDKLGQKLLGHRPFLQTLPTIIEWVTTNE